MLSRRSLIAGAGAAGAAWVGAGAAPPAAGAPGVVPGCGALAVLCAELRCPPTLAAACLGALPPGDGAATALAQLILAETLPLGGDGASPTVLRQAVSECSREDFRRGRIVCVEGWLLSLTETRVYALTGLLRA